MGFLKSKSAGIRDVESLLDKVWGEVAVGIKMMVGDTALMQLQSIKEVGEVLACAYNISESPFKAINRWMEVIGSPSCPQWVRMSGVPPHAWII